MRLTGCGAKRKGSEMHHVARIKLILLVHFLEFSLVYLLYSHVLYFYPFRFSLSFALAYHRFQGSGAFPTSKAPLIIVLII